MDIDTYKTLDVIDLRNFDKKKAFEIFETSQVKCISLTTGDLLDFDGKITLPAQLKQIFIELRPCADGRIKQHTEACTQLMSRITFPFALTHFVVQNWAIDEFTFPRGNKLPSVHVACFLSTNYLKMLLMIVFEKQLRPPVFVFCAPSDNPVLFEKYMQILQALPFYFNRRELNETRMRSLYFYVPTNDQDKFKKKIELAKRENEKYLKMLKLKFNNPF